MGIMGVFLQSLDWFPLKQVVYLPFIMKSENAQVTVTKDFKEDLDKFISTLTESIYKAKGQTLLYIPPLELVGTLKEQAANKELTQRLEQIIIRWTRQIREVGTLSTTTTAQDLSLEWTSLLLPFPYSKELFKTVNFVAAFGAHDNLPYSLVDWSC